MKHLLVLLGDRGFHHCHSKNKIVQIGKPVLSMFSLVPVSRKRFYLVLVTFQISANTCIITFRRALAK